MTLFVVESFSFSIINQVKKEQGGDISNRCVYLFRRSVLKACEFFFRFLFSCATAKEADACFCEAKQVYCATKCLERDNVCSFARESEQELRQTEVILNDRLRSFAPGKRGVEDQPDFHLFQVL